MIEGALTFAIGAVALALLLTSVRLVLGPSPVDRVLALDTLYVNTVGLVILLGLRLSSDLLFEAALVIAMLGFIATVALARFIARGDVME
jgi:multicomponent K+:H+ antiporter subunit F